MFKNAFAIVLLGSFVATSSVASNFVNKFKITEKMKAPQITLNKNDNQDYANFTGVWKGKCSNSGAEFTTTIRNDANTLYLDHDEITIGDLKTVSASGKSGTSFAHEAYFWNADRTMLLVKGIDITKESSNQLSSLVLSGSISLNNDQLIIQSDVDMFADLTQRVDGFNLTCTFNRSVN
jgi:hypothetical protein